MSTSVSSPFCLRPAGPGDFIHLRFLENDCFVVSRRETDSGLRRSLFSRAQEVWVLEGEERFAGALMLRLHPFTLRIYSIAVHPAFRGRGLGDQLLAQAVERAHQRCAVRMVLEVDAADTCLVEWYTRQGFRPVRLLPDYYGPHMDGLRMERRLEKRASS